MPNEEELAQLTALCKDEASGKEGAPFETVPPGALKSAPGGASIRIHKLNDVCGVNALKDGTGIDFGDDNITIVYGQNGSGKTGFARLLKHACGSRAIENILPNVFEAATPPSTAKST